MPKCGGASVQLFVSMGPARFKGTRKLGTIAALVATAAILCPPLPGGPFGGINSSNAQWQRLRAGRSEGVQCRCVARGAALRDSNKKEIIEHMESSYDRQF